MPANAPVSESTGSVWDKLITLAYQRPMIALALSSVFAVTLVLVPVLIAWPDTECPEPPPCPEPLCDCMDVSRAEAACSAQEELLLDALDRCRERTLQAKEETKAAQQGLLECLMGKIDESIGLSDFLRVPPDRL